MPELLAVLKGKAARDFEAYAKRPATQEEIKYMKNAEAFYLSHIPKEDKKCTLKNLRKR